MELNHKIIITGGNGRFGSILKNIYKSNRLFYPSKKELNILSTKSVEKYLNKVIEDDIYKCKNIVIGAVFQLKSFDTTTFLIDSNPGSRIVIIIII
jgi:dTDP-4-dehydrorhamnose reductase